MGLGLYNTVYRKGSMALIARIVRHLRSMYSNFNSCNVWRLRCNMLPIKLEIPGLALLFSISAMGSFTYVLHNDLHKHALKLRGFLLTRRQTRSAIIMGVTFFTPINGRPT